jgi:formate dehydrogenase major subunit
MTNSFGEFAKAKMFFCIGTNMTEAHPVAATFLKNAVMEGAELILVDPRKQPLADFATMHVPIRVGSDIAFLNGLMHVLITENLYDKAFVDERCKGFEELKATVMNYPPEKAAEIAGISVELLSETARKLASVKPVMCCYTLGITEHTCGRNNVLSVANLQMLLGNMGLECGGVNPLRGQNNVQGACDMGALPNVFPGYQQVASADARAKFEKAWGVDKLPDKPGLMIPQMMEGLVTGKVKALWIFGENLASTEPDIAKVEHELSSAEFLICNDIFPNWWIFKEVAKRLGQDWSSTSGPELWDNEVSVLAPAYGGIKYSRIENDGLQWPCPNVEHPGTAFLHRDGKFTHGKGVFTVAEWTPPAEVPDEEYPFVLSTGRRLFHYHTRTQTGRCGMDLILPEETADISPRDARQRGIGEGDRVRVWSRRGEVTVRARITEEVPPGMVWMAFHFREGNANWLTNPVFDPYTQTAEYKACAVNLEKSA